MVGIIMPLLGFVLLFLELVLLIKLGQGIGGGLVFAEIVLSGLLGYSLMRFVGRTVFQPAQLIGVFLHAVGSGFSSRKPVELLLFGSLLLIIPGILTDILGLIFIARFFVRGGSLRQPPSSSDSIDIEFDVHDDNQT
ncbi:FxsA family protein [Candidatus Bipolaricaulota bacterium]|nr:FxsA family protein [Candidatus Bipolaricaulota bacterium]